MAPITAMLGRPRHLQWKFRSGFSGLAGSPITPYTDALGGAQCGVQLLPSHACRIAEKHPPHRFHWNPDSSGGGTTRGRAKYIVQRAETLGWRRDRDGPRCSGPRARGALDPRRWVGRWWHRRNAPAPADPGQRAADQEPTPAGALPRVVPADVAGLTDAQREHLRNTPPLQTERAGIHVGHSGNVKTRITAHRTGPVAAPGTPSSTVCARCSGCAGSRPVRLLCVRSAA